MMMMIHEIVAEVGPDQAGFWVWAVLFVLSSATAILLRPDPKGPKPATFESFDFPTAQEGRAIPVVFGTVKLSDPNVVWYGDYGTSKIQEDTK